MCIAAWCVFAGLSHILARKWKVKIFPIKKMHRWCQLQQKRGEKQGMLFCLVGWVNLILGVNQRGRRREEGSDRSLVWASPSNNFSCMHCRVSMGWCGCIQLSIWDKGREGYPPFPQVLFTIFPRFNNSFIRERNKKLMVKRSKQKQTK